MAKRVLVVEDDMKNRRLIKDLLIVAGFDVLETDKGEVALALAKQEKPDVIVQDIRLADMRGTEVALCLRQDPRTCGIPIVFVTASVLGEGVAEAKSIPNSFFMTKPIDTRNFAKEILRVAGGA